MAKKDKQEQTREGPQQPPIDMQTSPDAQLSALKDALQREKQRADAADREAKEWQSLAGQMQEDSKIQRETFQSAQAKLEQELEQARRRIGVLEARGDVFPSGGWSSPLAQRLVEQVAPDARLLLLGDLLAFLAPHVGETGVKETAADTLRRKLEHIGVVQRARQEMADLADALGKQRADLEQQLYTLQAAMVTERSPDAEHSKLLEQVAEILDNAHRLRGGEKNEAFDIVSVARVLVSEWHGLRELLSKQPMVAVAVRDDSTKALAERYSVGVLEWDGKAVRFDLLEGPARPWSDLIRVMTHAVATRLVPPTFR